MPPQMFTINACGGILVLPGRNRKRKSREKIMVYFVNVIVNDKGYTFDDFCATFTVDEYGSVEAAKVAAAEYANALADDEWIGNTAEYTIVGGGIG